MRPWRRRSRRAPGRAARPSTRPRRCSRRRRRMVPSRRPLPPKWLRRARAGTTWGVRSARCTTTRSKRCSGPLPLPRPPDPGPPTLPTRIERGGAVDRDLACGSDVGQPGEQFRDTSTRRRSTRRCSKRAHPCAPVDTCSTPSAAAAWAVRQGWDARSVVRQWHVRCCVCPVPAVPCKRRLYKCHNCGRATPVPRATYVRSTSQKD
mmetsp:Transcript_32766/g.81447  ORF Transcript_32766/g.81447 Transcript_32766/m.81447 type:complete len:206 (-) Transcript_32766:102-719(-)